MNTLIEILKVHVEKSDFKALIPVECFSLKCFQDMLHLQFDSHIQSFSHERMPKGFFKLKTTPVVRYKLTVTNVGGVRGTIKFKWGDNIKPDNFRDIENHLLGVVFGKDTLKEREIARKIA